MTVAPPGLHDSITPQSIMSLKVFALPPRTAPRPYPLGHVHPASIALDEAEMGLLHARVCMHDIKKLWKSLAFFD